MSSPTTTRRPKENRMRKAIAKLLDSVDRTIRAADEIKRSLKEFERVAAEESRK